MIDNSSLHKRFIVKEQNASYVKLVKQTKGQAQNMTRHDDWGQPRGPNRKPKTGKTCELFDPLFNPNLSGTKQALFEWLLISVETNQVYTILKKNSHSK